MPLVTLEVDTRTITPGHLLAVPAWLRLANWWHLGERGGSQDPTET